jgi:hypothetical protein
VCPIRTLPRSFEKEGLSSLLFYLFQNLKTCQSSNKTKQPTNGGEEDLLNAYYEDYKLHSLKQRQHT